MWWRKSKDDLGCWGEEQAKKFLKQKGYKILAEHWTCRYGELDLVAYQNGSYVFVEVKTRSSDLFGAPEEAIPFWKQNKLRAAAELFLLKNKLRDVFWQIDAVLIKAGPGVGEWQIKHLKNVVEDRRYGRY
ncbi:MAG: YraN family protein [bacterium]|nr:YraN family protein [bacterium]